MIVHVLKCLNEEIVYISGYVLQIKHSNIGTAEDYLTKTHKIIIKEIRVHKITERFLQQ